MGRRNAMYRMTFLKEPSDGLQCTVRLQLESIESICVGSTASLIDQGVDVELENYRASIADMPRDILGVKRP